MTDQVVAGAALPVYISNNTDRGVQAGSAIPVYLVNSLVSSGGVTVHNELTGLFADDHAQYLVLIPSSTARNTISVPTATVTGLTLKSTDNSATLPLLNLQTSTGVSVLTVQSSLSGTSISSNYLNLVATLPSVSSAAIRAINIDIVGAGSSGQQQIVLAARLSAGYTGSAPTEVVAGSNYSAGTASSLLTGSANMGLHGTANGTTTGANIGSSSLAGNGNINVGVRGAARTGKDGALNVGVFGVAHPSSGVGMTYVAGYFGLDSSEPVFTTSALVANNAATSDPIFLGQDGGSTVFQVLDGGRINILNGVLAGNSSVENFFNITGILPSVTTTTTNGINFQITSAGSTSNAQVAARIDLLAGYTGSSSTSALTVTNNLTSTGSSLISGTGNTGISATVFGSTTGLNIGVTGVGNNGDINVGIRGRSNATKNNATNIGVVGFGINAGTTSIQVGGYFGLNSATPTFESAGLIADNSTTTSPIFLARDGGVRVFEILDGGVVVITGSLQVDTIVNDTGLAHGKYTPTLTNVANLAASTAYECQYIRVGNTITVSGKVDVDPTLAVTSTQLGISLPVASNFGAAEDCAGTAFSPTISGMGAAILADTTNDRAQMQFVSSDTNSNAMYFTFTYEVL